MHFSLGKTSPVSSEKYSMTEAHHRGFCSQKTCSWREPESGSLRIWETSNKAEIWGGIEVNQEEKGGETEVLQLMIFQRPEDWQVRVSQSYKQISPLFLGRGKLPASEHENTGGQCKEREQGEEGGQLIHPAHLSLAGKHWLLPRGQHSLQGPTSPTANSGHCHLPAVKPTAAQVATLLLDHQASSRVCLKGIFARNKMLRPLFLGCLAEHCCHVFMAIAAGRRWDPKWGQL